MKVFSSEEVNALDSFGLTPFAILYLREFSGKVLVNPIRVKIRLNKLMEEDEELLVFYGDCDGNKAPVEIKNSCIEEKFITLKLDTLDAPSRLGSNSYLDFTGHNSFSLSIFTSCSLSNSFKIFR